MVVVDSGVWIDFFNGTPTPAADVLARLLAEGEVRLVVPDLVLYEVLRGFRHERDFRQARLLMESLPVEPCGGEDAALSAAQHYRALRASGRTVRGAIDTLIASFCIERDYALLHGDRDYEAFAELRGLHAWPA